MVPAQAGSSRMEGYSDPTVDVADRAVPQQMAEEEKGATGSAYGNGNGRG